LKDRLRFVKITEQMKAWSAALDAELQDWQGVTSKRMFGMTVYFRKRVIFAALPLTRAFETPTTVAFKLYRQRPETLRKLNDDPLISSSAREAPKWILLELHGEKDLRHAVKWFDFAYRECLLKNN
jgi:hypothetical protein